MDRGYKKERGEMIERGEDRQEGGEDGGKGEVKEEGMEGG